MSTFIISTSACSLFSFYLQLLRIRKIKCSLYLNLMPFDLWSLVSFPSGNCSSAHSFFKLRFGVTSAFISSLLSPLVCCQWSGWTLPLSWLYQLRLQWLTWGAQGARKTFGVWNWQFFPPPQLKFIFPNHLLCRASCERCARKIRLMYLGSRLSSPKWNAVN